MFEKRAGGGSGCGSAGHGQPGGSDASLLSHGSVSRLEQRVILQGLTPKPRIADHQHSQSSPSEAKSASVVVWLGGKDASLRGTRVHPLGPPQPSGGLSLNMASLKEASATLPLLPGHTSPTNIFSPLSLAPLPSMPFFLSSAPPNTIHAQTPSPLHGLAPTACQALHSSSLQPGHTVQHPSPPILP